MTLTITRTDDFQACFAVRRAVFIDEQNVPEAEEMDDLDAQATHFLACIDGDPVGTARIVFDGSKGKIGRVCVMRKMRGTGLGAAIMRAVLDHLGTVPHIDTAVLGSQTHAIEFYEKLGFRAYGPEFDDAGIPHRMMSRAV